MADLEALKVEIDHVGNEIKTLKASGGDVSALVQELLKLKQTYADNNNGIGVDGKPLLSKAEQKKLQKQQKQQQQQQEQQQQEGQEQNSANAAKKADKKAAKKAAKEAYKAGTGTPAGDSGAAAATSGPSASNKSTKSATSTGPGSVPTTLLGSNNYQVAPMQLSISPNVPLIQRPVLALTMAIWYRFDVDLTLVSDHRIHPNHGIGGGALLGLEDGTIVTGDVAMTRYLLANSSYDSTTMTSLVEQAHVDSWMEYATTMRGMMTMANATNNPDTEQQAIKGMAMTLEHALQSRTYLVGNQLTMADVAMFAALGFPTQAVDYYTLMKSPVLSKYPNAQRWVSMMRQFPPIQKATQLALGINGTTEAILDESVQLEPLVKGMNLLQGGLPGNVVTRFPPEPSGYLHIGHAKAVLLNDYYARRYKGRLIVRFDDTNPSKEKEEFQISILQDLKLLGVTPNVVTYTSDYFNVIHGYALQLIQQGMAYMDDTPQEQMKLERAQRIESKYRNTQTADQAKELFLLMCNGHADGAKWCLRAKINMQSDNGTLRDPVLYRQNLTPHHRSGTKHKAYPTYDLACPIVDSIEGVTHALRTTEYNDRDEQYQWIIKALQLRRVRIHAFSRVNFVYTVLSKRKLAWFVDQGLVSGWDDARFPTVRGVVRRGVHLEALRQFIYAQGASRRVVNMEWSQFWAENKKELDKIAKRYMAIDKVNHVVLTVTNAPSEQDHAYLTTSFHPKDPSLGHRVLRIAQQVLLEQVDVDGITVGEDIVLLRWGVVKITKVENKDSGNAACSLEGEFIPDGDFKSAKRKLSWIADIPSSNPTVVLTEFDHLVTKEKLEEEDSFEEYVNPHTMATTEVIGDPGLKTLQEHDIIQLERRGFYRVDRPYTSSDKPLILYMIPDGKSKAMSGLAGKLSHK